jgi:hypothetical protein
VPSVGTVNLALLKGRPMEAALMIEILERPGVDGFGAREVARRSEAERLYGTQFVESIAAAGTLQTAIRELQGELVSVTDELGISHPDCMIRRAAPRGTPRLVYLLSGGTLLQRYRVDAEFEVIREPE